MIEVASPLKPRRITPVRMMNPIMECGSDLRPQDDIIFKVLARVIKSMNEPRTMWTVSATFQ